MLGGNTNIPSQSQLAPPTQTVSIYGHDHGLGKVLNLGKNRLSKSCPAQGIFARRQLLKLLYVCSSDERLISGTCNNHRSNIIICQPIKSSL
jgi:hypothetical protein